MLLLVSACVCTAADFSVDEALQNYRRFTGRRITFTGLAEVAGSDFYVWDLRDTRHKDLKRMIWVLWDMRLPNYPPGSNIAHYSYLNLRPVRISGTVDTRFHGRWGDIPFGVILDRVEALPGDRERRFLRDIGVFHNSLSKTVEVRLYSRRDSVYCYMTGIPPGEYGDTAIEEGSASVALQPRERKLALRPDTVVARCNISLSGASRRYYDARQHAYYYDITPGKIGLVMPTEAQRWKLLPMVDRN